MPALVRGGLGRWPAPARRGAAPLTSWTAPSPRSPVRVQTLIVLADPALMDNLRGRVVDLAATSRLPAMYDWRAYVDAVSMSYGPNMPDMQRRAASYVDKILKGAKPADLPIEQPTTFNLVINSRLPGPRPHHSPHRLVPGQRGTPMTALALTIISPSAPCDAALIASVGTGEGAAGWDSGQSAPASHPILLPVLVDIALGIIHRYTILT